MVDKTIDINHMPVAYSPNDFFYQAVDQTMNPSKCDELDDNALSVFGQDIGTTDINVVWDVKCKNIEKTTDEPELLANCYQHELCKNQKYTKTIANTNINHSGADGRYSDTRTMYNMEYLTLGNLSFGVLKLIVVMGLIYYNK